MELLGQSSIPHRCAIRNIPIQIPLRNTARQSALEYAAECSVPDTYLTSYGLSNMTGFIYKLRIKFSRVVHDRMHKECDVRMFPWMKSRSRLGKWIDRKGVTQEWLVRETGLNRSSISDLCDGTVENPRSATRSIIINALRQIDPNVSASELW